MRTALVMLTLAILTPPLGLLVIVAGMLRLPDHPGGVFEWAPRLWARALLFAAGVRVTVHNPERMRRGDASVFVANHISWFDVLAIAATFPKYKFIAKKELAGVPIFGPAIQAAGTIMIDRENRNAAFAELELAAQRIRDGASVVVYPEGTRGTSYALRPFKKGPFVLAIAAGAPIVPTVVYGTREILPRGSLRARSGEVHLHFLDPIGVDGLTYESRDELARATWTAMAGLLEREYGVISEFAPGGARWENERGKKHKRSAPVSSTPPTPTIT